MMPDKRCVGCRAARYAHVRASCLKAYIPSITFRFLQLPSGITDVGPETLLYEIILYIRTASLRSFKAWVL